MRIKIETHTMGSCYSICDIPLNRAEQGEYFSFKGQSVKAKIVSVYDGDTCTAVFRFKGRLIQYRIRLLGIDTPELKPLLSCPSRAEVVASAKRAKKALEDHVLNKVIILELGDFEKYGRILGTLYIRKSFNRKGENINKWLLNNGYAKEYYGGKKT